MWEGALIFLIGLSTGAAICYYANFFSQTKDKKAESPYEKYKTPEGLYSRKAVKAAKESR